MTDSAPPPAGSAAFAARLLARLRADPAVTGEVALDGVRATSRNTLIYRVRAGDAVLMCKAPRGRRAVHPELEFHMLRELRARLAGTGYGCVEAVAVYPELATLVTRLEPGSTVRHHIDRALRSPAGSEARRFAEALMEHCAAGLFHFHRGFGLERDAAGREQAASYVDIHPRNLLVPANAAGGLSLVMLDPPPKLRARPVHADLATFCFAVARAGFTPLALARLSQPWLDRLKSEFLAAYFRRLGRALQAADLDSLRELEHARAQRARLRYRQFLQYRNWPLELARMAYFAPIIRAYAAFYLPRSYRRIARACRAQAGSAA